MRYRPTHYCPVCGVTLDDILDPSPTNSEDYDDDLAKEEHTEVRHMTFTLDNCNERFSSLCFYPSCLYPWADCDYKVAQPFPASRKI